MQNLIRNTIRKINFLRLCFHMLYWIIYLFFKTFITLTDRKEIYTDNYWTYFINYAFTLPILLLANYFIIYYLLPKLILQNRKYLYFVLSSLIIILFVGLSDITIRWFILIPNYQPEILAQFKTYAYTWQHILLEIYINATTIIMFFTFKFFKDYIIGYSENEKLQQKRNNYKIDLIKKQLQPSFLFNTLHSIKSLAQSNDEENAAESVALVSEILRYSLYKDEENVKLEQELTVIYKYFKLKKFSTSDFAFEMVILNNIQEIEIPHLFLFNLIIKIYNLTVNKAYKKLLILKLSTNKQCLYLNISVSNNQYLNQKCVHDIRNIIESYFDKKAYKIYFANKSKENSEIDIYLNYFKN